MPIAPRAQQLTWFSLVIDRVGRLGERLSQRPARSKSRFARGLWVAAGAALAGVLAALVLSPSSPDGRENVDVLRYVEGALARGDLAAARALVSEIVARSPNDARARLLQGHVAFAEPDERRAVAAYTHALGIDPSVAHDAVFLANVRRLVLSDEGSKHAEAMVAAIAERADARIAPLLAQVADLAPWGTTRRIAFSGLERLGEAGRLDLAAYLTRELQRVPSDEKSCLTRRWYVERLGKLRDPSVLSALEGERQRRGKRRWIFEEEEVNGCMAAELEAIIRERTAVKQRSTRSDDRVVDEDARRPRTPSGSPGTATSTAR